MAFSLTAHVLTNAAQKVICLHLKQRTNWRLTLPNYSVMGEGKGARAGGRRPMSKSRLTALSLINRHIIGVLILSILESILNSEFSGSFKCLQMFMQYISSKYTIHWIHSLHTILGEKEIMWNFLSPQPPSSAAPLLTTELRQITLKLVLHVPVAVDAKGQMYILPRVPRDTVGIPFVEMV